MYLGIDFFSFILLDSLDVLKPWIGVFINSGKFSAIVSSYISSSPFSLLFLEL